MSAAKKKTKNPSDAQERLRVHLVAAAEALAELLGGTRAEEPQEEPIPVPDVARALAVRECKKRGWPVPPGGPRG